MEKFVMKKSTEANIYKSIRFPVEINSQIIDIVEKANKWLDKKEYSFNGFVVSACEFALKHMILPNPLIYLKLVQCIHQISQPLG